MTDSKSPKFEYAPRERILFVERLNQVFLSRVLNCEEALISDESCIWDFRDIFSYDIEDAIGPASRPGFYVFKKKKFLLGEQRAFSLEDIQRLRAQIPDEEIEAEPTYFRRDITLKTLEIFGVDIGPVFDRPLPEVLHYILVQMPDLKRSEFRAIFEKK